MEELIYKQEMKKIYISQYFHLKISFLGPFAFFLVQIATEWINT